MLLALVLACAPLTTPTAAAASDFDWVATGATAAPLSLTAADGTGLTLAEMHVEAVVDGPLAFTEVHLVFDNPEDRRIEGRFEITLPTGAAVSRFAMKIGDRWQEGEVVELQAARRAYEDFLHRRTDPALLEYDAGNEFRARVFPIEPRSRKEIILSWSHDLDVGEPWSLPTGGLPQLGRFTADVRVDGQRHTMETEYAVPEGDLTLPTADTPRMAYRGAQTSVVRVVPELSVAADPVRDAVVLVDTSASRALSFEALLADLAAVVPTFAGNVRVVAFDQDQQTVYDGAAKRFGQDALDALRARQPLGASDLTAALERIGSTDRVVVFSDGVLTAGDREAAPLVDALASLEIGRIDAVLRGGARDEALLARLAAGGARDGVLLDADALSTVEVARRLGLGTAGEVVLDVPGAEWIHPSTVSGLQPGDSLTVYADLPADQPLALHLDGRPIGRIPVTETEGPLLQRASAQAEIGALLRAKEEAPAEVRSAIIDAIVDVSIRNRVLSPHTALLVLETEADYARFDIPRDALTDILVVDDGELDWIRRKEPVLAGGNGAEAPTDPDRVDDSPVPEAKVKKSRARRMDAEDDALAAAPAAEPPPPPMAPMADMASEEAEERPRRQASPRTARLRRMAEQAASRRPEENERSMPAEESRRMEADEDEPAPMASQDPMAAWEGDFREVQVLLRAGDLPAAERFALAWRTRSPGDPLALLALGEVWQAMGRTDDAARAYGSLIDLFPSRADLRRLAGQRLEALDDDALPLAVDTYRVALEQRPDHPSSHRGLAWALYRTGEAGEALDVLEASLERPFDRFREAHRILREDAGLIAAAHRAAGGDVDDLSGGIVVATEPDLRFVLNWETDSNDVDFHIHDGKGGHAYYSDKVLRSGGELYADVTTGYGPECFAIPSPRAFPYRLQAHYYSRGPMGFGMGKLAIIEHDGKGGLSIEDRPFVVMTDGAYVPLGEVTGSAFR
jgi:tetratricopeptide (TPR) repeat protein